VDNEVFPTVALQLQMQKMPCQLHKANCHKSNMWLGRRVY